MGKHELTPLTGTEFRPSFFQSRAFTSLQREIDRLFDDFGHSFDRMVTVPSPKLDIGETDGEFEITAELPGLEEKDVEVSFADGVLTLSGEKAAEAERKDKTFTVSERTYGAFSRSVALPTGVDPAQIKATMTKGVLKVTVPKPAAVKTAKIAVQSVA